MAGAPVAGPGPVTPDEPPKRWGYWLTTPAGLSAIAAVVGCLIALASLILTNVIDLSPSSRAAPPATALATNQLFVYGSSQPGQLRYDAIAHYVKHSYADWVTGYLYDSNLDYPAAKFGPGDRIAGTVLIIHEESEEEFFAEMTLLESGFALKQVRTIESKQLVRAFEWIGPTDELERIDHWPRSAPADGIDRSKTIAFQGRRYTCGQALQKAGGLCDTDVQIGFNRWGDNLVAFANDPLLNVEWGEEVISFELLGVAGLTGCSFREEDNAFGFVQYMKHDRYGAPGRNEAAVATLYGVAGSVLCPDV